MMTRFVDGPARGITLLLTSSPLFIRAVRDRHNVLDNHDGWSALLFKAAEPKRTESVYAYRLVACRGTIQVRRTGRPDDSTVAYTVADYSLVEDQPDDAVMRDWLRWSEWCAEGSRHADAAH